MIETEVVTVLSVWTCEESERDELAEKISEESKQHLQEELMNGYRIKLATSSAIGDRIFVTYVLERDKDTMTYEDMNKFIYQGGIIKDKNGNCCRNGDKIIFKNSVIGELFWDKTLSKFKVAYKQNGCSVDFYTEFLVEDIEKYEV